MKFRALLLAATVCIAMSSAFPGSLSVAQEMPAKTGAAAVEEKITGRLPNNYGKLGLSDAQRARIYQIQANYRARISALLLELEDLRAEESLEIQNTLTEDQKNALQSLLNESRKKRESKPTKS